MGVQKTRWVRTVDYPWGSSMEDAVKEIEYVAEHGITDEYLFGPDEELPEEKKQAHPPVLACISNSGSCC